MPKEYDLGPLWPTSGAATGGPGTSGLSVCSGFTHQLTTNRMSGAKSSSVLAGAIGTTCGFRIGGVSGAGALFDADPWATIRFKMRPRIELPGSLTTTEFFVNAFQFLNNNSKVIVYFTSRYQSGRSGFTVYTQNFVGGGVHYQPNYGAFPYNQWIEVSIRMKKAVDGVLELFFNRHRVSHARGDYSTFIANTPVNFPALPGIVWEVEDVEQWAGSDAPMAPLHELNSPIDDIQRLWAPYNDSRNHPEPTLPGSDALVTQVSGTSTYTYQAVSSSGSQSFQSMILVAGSGSVESREWNWNETPWFDGWAGFYLPMEYFPAGSTGSLALYRDNALLATIGLNQTANQLTVGGTNYASFSSSVRNAICLAFSQKGELDVCTIDQSTLAVTPYMFGANLPDLAQGLTPNRVVLTSSVGASGVQHCSAVLTKTLRMIGVDSMTTGPTNTGPIAAPVFQVSANITGYKYLSDIHGVSAFSPWAEHSEFAGRPCAVTAGRAGQKLSEFVANQLPALAVMRGGVTLQLFEGGINDVAGVTTMAEAKATVDACYGYDSALKAWASAKAGRRLIMSTIIDRSLSGHWSGAPSSTIVGARLSAIRAINVNRRALFGSPGPSDRYSLADAAAMIRTQNHAAMIDTGNPPHFLEAGNVAYFGAVCAAEAAVVRGAAARSRVYASGAIAGGIY